MLPPAFETKMRRLLGPEWDELLAAWEKPRAAGLRLNPAKPPRPLPFALTPVPWEEHGFYYDPADRPGLHPFHDAGLYYLQEPSAMAPAALLAPRPGEWVLDLCAAPGGKSGQLAAALRGTGLLVSNEIRPQRAAVLSRNLERLGIPNALVLSEHPARLAARFPRAFDRVLVDAPCSGEGMFRKEEAALRDWTEDTPRLCARRQREILESAALTVKAGGILCYSTCTFSPEENEGVISDFLRDHGEFSLLPPSMNCFSPGRPDFLPDPVPHLERTVRLWPHRLRGEGHFCALLQYNGREASQIPAEPGMTMPPALKDFLRAADLRLPQGSLAAFQGRLYLLPPGAPALGGLRVLRPGLCLGREKKGRFEPDHALSHYLDGPIALDLPPEDPGVAAYLRGETLPGDFRGWGLAAVDGLPLGFVKGAGGVLKNHYPKGLRRP